MDLRVRSQRSHDQSGIKHYYLIFDLCKLKVVLTLSARNVIQGSPHTTVSSQCLSDN